MMINTTFVIIILFFLYILFFSLMVSIRMKKRDEIKLFDVEKLKKFQTRRRIGVIILMLSISIIIYSWYRFDIFTGFIVLAWICLLISIFSILSTQGRIMEQKKAKLKIKYILEQNKTKTLLELAQEIEYPYSILKQIVDYLTKKGELPNHSFP